VAFSAVQHPPSVPKYMFTVCGDGVGVGMYWRPYTADLLHSEMVVINSLSQVVRGLNRLSQNRLEAGNG
jgi:hypothetical protein